MLALNDPSELLKLTWSTLDASTLLYHKSFENYPRQALVFR